MKIINNKNMTLIELLNKIEDITKTWPEYWLDQSVMILNSKGLYCETKDIEIDGKARICIVEETYKK